MPRLATQTVASVAGMEFTDVIRRRRMIRAFTTDPLPEGTADRLLKASPSPSSFTAVAGDPGAPVPPSAR